MVNLNHSERKNIWIAASDGDLDRVKELVESGIPPMIHDENSYTPLHAAASWGHKDVLRYLCSVGGNINITDDDGDTPLFSVEDLETAELIIELGGDPNHKNDEGLTPAESLFEEYPEISNYLRDLAGEPHLSSSKMGDDEENDSIKDQSENDPTNLITSSLLDQVRNIMTEAEANGESIDSKEVDEKLRKVVAQSVDESVGIGKTIGSSSSTSGNSNSSANPNTSDSSRANNNLETVSEIEESSQKEDDSNKRQRT